MKLFNLSEIINYNLFILTNEPINYRWGGNLNYSEIEIILNDYVICNINILFLKIKKIINLTTFISFQKGICLFIFLNFYRRFFFNDLSQPNMHYLYLLFIDRIYSFLTKFKYFLTRYKNIKYYSNYANPLFGSNRLPTIVFSTKKCWKIYKKFFNLFLKLRIISIKSNSLIDFNDNNCYNIFINDCKYFYFMFKLIYLISNKEFSKW